VVALPPPPLPPAGLSRAGQLAWLLLFGATASSCVTAADGPPVANARSASATLRGAPPGTAVQQGAAPPAAVPDAGRSPDEEDAPNIAFPSVAFDHGSVVPPVGADATLKQVADAFRAHPDYTVLLSGHADASEQPKVLPLSSFRARNVRDALVALGVPAEKVLVFAYGDDRPGKEAAIPAVVRMFRDLGRGASVAQNRRVEAVLIPPPRPRPPGDRLSMPIYGISGFAPVTGFAPRSAAISPALARSLEGMAEVLLVQPWLVVEITGHAQPSEPSGQDLSERRAQAAMKHLVELGVPEDRLTAKGYGSKVDVWAADGPARNRSVWFRILEGTLK